MAKSSGLPNEPIRLLSFDAATSPAVHPGVEAEDRRGVGEGDHQAAGEEDRPGVEAAAHQDAAEDRRDVGEGERRRGPAAES